MVRAFSTTAARDWRVGCDLWKEVKADCAFWPMALISEDVAARRVRMGLLVEGEIVVIWSESMIDDK